MSEDITQLVERSRSDPAAREELWARVIGELRRLAHARLNDENAGHTLETDALINELYLKLDGRALDVNNRTHFLAVAARQLRHILVDHARAKRSAKRGGDMRPLTLSDPGRKSTDLQPDVLDLHRALTELEQEDEQTAAVLELHYFSGMSFADIALATGVSVPTVTRKMRMGKAWLRHQLLS